MNSVKRDVDPGTLSVGQILRLLKPAQLWAVITTIGALLAFAFTIGSWTARNAVESEIKDLRRIVERYRGLETKDLFLSLYLRYLLAGYEVKREDSPGNIRRRKTAAQALEKTKVRRIHCGQTREG